MEGWRLLALRLETGGDRRRASAHLRTNADDVGDRGGVSGTAALALRAIMEVATTLES
jgi:hypothetical protein